MAKIIGQKYITDNRKARHDYFIHDTYEAGIALTGTEVKSLRQGKVNLKDSFCRIENGEILLVGMHISPYEQGNRFNHEPLRIRKLLLHKYEIMKLLGITKEKGYTAAKPGLQSLIGKTGTAKTVLRPSGTAEIEDQFVDVVTSGEYVEEGAFIQVMDVEGMRVIVREVRKE